MGMDMGTQGKCSSRSLWFGRAITMDWSQELVGERIRCVLKRWFTAERRKLFLAGRYRELLRVCFETARQQSAARLIVFILIETSSSQSALSGFQGNGGVVRL